MPMRYARLVCIFVLTLAACSEPHRAVTQQTGKQPADPHPHEYDWPQWQGPDRTGVSHETGLLSKWPTEGPPFAWRIKGSGGASSGIGPVLPPPPEHAWKIKGLGGGYSGPSVAAGRLFGMSYRGADEVVWALDEASGDELWSTRIASANHHISSPGQEGSHCTPTVDGDLTYALGVSGDLVCLETASGKEVWHHNLVNDFGGHMPSWGYSESPLVDGNKVLATPGGNKATLVAVDNKSGALIWKAQVPGGNGATYSSIIAGNVDGQQQYMQLLNGGVVGVAADDGKFLWRYKEPGHGISCSTPIYQDHLVFAASGYGVGGGLARLTRSGGETHAEQVYFTKKMENHHGGMIVIDGYLYGYNNRGALVCLEFKTGKVMWESSRTGKGSLSYADGHLYYRQENGPVLLIEANPREYVEHGRFSQPERSSANSWPHPVIANGKMYLRDQDVLLCYDVKKH